MTLSRFIRAASVTLACCGMLIPAPFAMGQQAATDTPMVAVDVALEAGNLLQGTIVDAAGQPKAGSNVELRRQNELLVAATTDDEGRFSMQLEMGGVYIFSTGDQVMLLRCWATDTAPPSSRTRLVVQASDVVRGQIHPAACGLANPWVITGIAVAAIVIPVALHNNRGDRDAGSN